MNYAQKIIQSCGGVRALARLMKRPASTVGSWGDRGSIPDEVKAQILSLSNLHGFGLAPSDFFPAELMPDATSMTGADQGACSTPDEDAA